MTPTPPTAPTAPTSLPSNETELLVKRLNDAAALSNKWGEGMPYGIDDLLTEAAAALCRMQEDLRAHDYQLGKSVRALNQQIAAAQANERDAAKRTPQTSREDIERGAGAWLPDSERRLRKMLAFAYSGVHLYGDDGELQDSRLPHPIDYMRDSVEQIEAAIYERGMAAYRATLDSQLAAGEKGRE